MIKHIVMWKLKDYAEGANKEENANIIKKRLENLKSIISEIKYMEIGININSKDKTAYDAVLISEFDSEEALSLYKNHPEHLKVAEFVKNVREARTVVDYKI